MNWQLPLALVLNALANILIRAGAKGKDVGLDGRVVRLMLDPYVLGGIVSFGLALVFYAWALTRIDVSTAYPIMTAGGLILVAGAGIWLFDEALTASKAAGLLLILVGVLVLARQA